MSDYFNTASSYGNNYQAPKTLGQGNSNTEKSRNVQPSTQASNLGGILVEEENKGVKVEDFLNLMISQLTNQDFMNPMDDTQYITQLAQFSTMQQMQELAYNSKANFMSSLVGKEVTAAKLSLGGDVNKTTGVVTKLSLVDGKFNFYIEGSDKAFTFEQIMEIKTPSTDNDGDDVNTGDQVDPGDNVDTDDEADNGDTGDNGTDTGTEE